MPRITIPRNAGEFRVVFPTRAGTYAIWNGRTGKNKVLIPCKSKEQAEELLRRLREGDHDGWLWA